MNFGKKLTAMNVLVSIVLVFFALSNLSVRAMESSGTWKAVMQDKERIVFEFERELNACRELGRGQEIFNIYAQELETSSDSIKKYVRDIDGYARQIRSNRSTDEEMLNFAKGRVEYMKLLLEKVRAIRAVLQESSATPAGVAKQGGAIFGSCCEQILAKHGLRRQNLVSDRSIPLKDGAETVGWARAYPYGVVIELKGASQECDMACGVAAYSYARILDTVYEYPQLLRALRDKKLLQGYEHELHDAIIGKIAEIFGPRQAQAEWERMMRAEGLGIDWLYKAGLARNLSVGADDAKLFTIFPSGVQAENLVKAGKKEWLKYSFYPRIKQVCADADVQVYALPKTVILLTGHAVEKAGHWIAVHFEKMTDGRIGIIFADSCPYAREQGCIVEAIDKIEVYHAMFAGWGTSMPSYLK